MTQPRISTAETVRVMGGVNKLVALSDLPDATLALIGQSFCLEASDDMIIGARAALRTLLRAIESEYEKRGL